MESERWGGAADFSGVEQKERLEAFDDDLEMVMEDSLMQSHDRAQSLDDANLQQEELQGFAQASPPMNSFYGGPPM